MRLWRQSELEAFIFEPIFIFSIYKFFFTSYYNCNKVEWKKKTASVALFLSEFVEKGFRRSLN